MKFFSLSESTAFRTEQRGWTAPREEQKDGTTCTDPSFFFFFTGIILAARDLSVTLDDVYYCTPVLYEWEEGKSM